MTLLDYVEAWNQATDQVRAAIHHRIKMKEKNGDVLAELAYWKAWQIYKSATDQMANALNPA